MKKHYLFFSLFILLGAATCWAQQKIITGIVNDENGLPLPGATIVIENTSRGVSSDFNGNYSIEAEENDVLIFSFIGYVDQKVTIGAADSYTVSLQPGYQLEEVVVSALGSVKENRALGYSIQTVQGENNKQTTISEKNPSEGEKNLSICQ